MSNVRPGVMSWVLLLAGVAAGAACVAGLLHGEASFFRAYLYSYTFWLGLSLGSMGMMMIHYLTGGKWGVAIGRGARAATWTLPVMVVLFVPIVLGMRELYAWARPDGGRELLVHRGVLMNPTFFVGRAIVYFAIWIGFAAGLYYGRGSAAAVRRLSALGLVVYLLTGTHAAIDWLMSRDVAFYSTTYGFIFVTGQAVSALAFLIVVWYLGTRWGRSLVPAGIRVASSSLPAVPPAPAPARGETAALGAVKESTLEPDAKLGLDLGNLLMTVIILWIYIQFFQLLVIWMGNTREDNGWYLERGIGQGSAGSIWRWIGLGLVVFHFFVPFFLLLFRRVKKSWGALALVALLVLAMHLVEQYWLVAPSGDHRASVFDLSWVDVLMPVAMGGIWLFVFLRLYMRFGVTYGT